MRPVLTKGCGDRLHQQDQHSNSRVIVAGEQYVHCLRRSALQRRGRVHDGRGLGKDAENVVLFFFILSVFKYKNQAVN